MYETATVLRATTHLVVVDVVATGRNRGPVKDLTEQDFHLYEDGKEQKISAFGFHDAATETEAKVPSEKLPENVFSNTPAYKKSAALNVILFDILNTSLPDQVYIRDRMIDFLKKLPQDKPIAIYTMGHRLWLLQDFTSDPAVLRTAVEGLKSKPSPVMKDNMGGTDDIMPYDVFQTLPPLMQQSLLEREAHDTANEADFRALYTLDILDSLAHALAGYPGRKNLLWISDGIPFTVGFEKPGQLNPGQLNNHDEPRTYGYQITRVSELLASAQIAVYPIYAGGLLPPGGAFDAQNSGNDGVLQPVDASQDYASMAIMANITGGTFYHNRNDLDGAAREAIADGSSYYTLAYYPTNKKWNGAFRKIKVKTSRSGLTLRYRMRYRAINPEGNPQDKKSPETLALNRSLDLNFPASTDLQFKAMVLGPSEKTHGKVMVNFGADSHAVRFDEEEDGTKHASLQCFVQPYSVKGKPLATKGEAINATLKPDQYEQTMRQGFVPCQVAFDIAPGEYRLRLAVRDNTSGLIGSTNAKVTVTQTAVLQPATQK